MKEKVPALLQAAGDWRFALLELELSTVAGCSVATTLNHKYTPVNRHSVRFPLSLRAHAWAAAAASACAAVVASAGPVIRFVAPPGTMRGVQNTKSDSKTGLHVCIDWLQFTLGIEYLDWARQLLPDGEWTKAKSGLERGYPEGELNGTASLSYGVRDELHVKLTGQAMARLRALGRCEVELLRLVAGMAKNIARLDVAYDAVGERAKLLDLRRMERSLRDGTVCTRFRQASKQEDFQIQRGEEQGSGLWLGSKYSDSRIRCYNKQLESNSAEPWMRLEAQLRDDNAAGMVAVITSAGLEATTGIIAGLIDFKKPAADKNKSRWPRAKWWDEFLCSAKRSTLNLLKPTRTVEEARAWLLNQCSAMLAVVAGAGGEDGAAFGRELVEVGRQKFRKRHRLMTSAMFQQDEFTQKVAVAQAFNRWMEERSRGPELCLA